MKEIQFNFDVGSFNNIFPFYVLIDKNLNIKSVGKSIVKIIPELKENKCFTDSFQILRPHLENLIPQNFNQLLGRLCVIVAKSNKTISLRGQFEIQEDYFLFVGSPWFSSVEDMVEKQLTLHDFAFHDPLLDLLLILKNQEINNAELKELLTTINKQKNDLKKANKEIYEIALFPTQNPDPILRIDFEGNLLKTNPAANNFKSFVFEGINYETEAFFKHIVHKIDINEERWIFEAISEKKYFSFVCKSLKKQGYINIYGRDISQQKQSQEELNKLSLVASANKNGVVLCNLDGKVFWVNDSFLELTGYTKSDIIDKTLVDLGVSELTNLGSVKKMISSFNEGIPFDSEVFHKKKNKSSFWTRMKGQPVLDSKGNFVQYFVIIEDITKEKAIKDKLKESENRLSSLILNLQSGILLQDENRKILLVNKKFCNMFGIELEPETMIGFDCTNSAEQVKEMFKNKVNFVNRINEILSKKELVAQEELELLDGRFFERRYIPIIIDGDFKGNLWSYDDITLKKNYTESINYEKEKYRSIIDNMNIGLVEVDNDGIILLANQRFSEMSGYTVSSLIGKKGAELLLLEEDIEKLQGKQIDRTKGISNSYEINVKNKDGEEKTWLISGAPNYNLNGEAVGSIGLHFDITEIKKLERRQQLLLEKLERQNEQLNDYAHIVSHDLKSPLLSIHSLITFIKEDTDVVFNDKTIKYFNMIQDKTEKMELLIQGILNYSQIENTKKNKTKINLNHVIDNVKEIIFIPSNIKIITKNKLPVVNNDLFRMQQLFQNLIGNAVNYNDKSSGYVEISSEEFEDHFVFAIKDNGVGIEGKNQKKIFEMFQSFNAEYKSTGIGLSIVKKILSSEDEKIWLESEKGVGTTFFFTLKK